ncbi:hypothetical protein HR11_10235 [Porphyromonas macacae]|nr:hypothetical protein HR11_10235 [Porphyromonas macacae]
MSFTWYEKRRCAKVRIACKLGIKNRTVCDNAQIADSLAIFGLVRVIQFAPLSLSLSTLYFTHFDARERGCAKNEF